MSRKFDRFLRHYLPSKVKCLLVAMFAVFLTIFYFASDLNVYAKLGLQIKDVPKKRIVLWNTFFGNKHFFPVNLNELQCWTRGEPTCQLETEPGHDYTQADAIVFHAYNVDRNHLPKARGEESRQIWAMYNYEPPINCNKKVFEKLNHEIDLVISYRQDSDFYSPYSLFFPKNDSDKGPNRVDFENKKLVVSLVSNCNSSSKREDYIRELKKYIDVDVFGKCGKAPKLCKGKKSDINCYRSLSEKYMFFLSFENSLCRDYVTEKFFLALETGMIPVTFGGADYDQFAPRGSFINALEFDHPKILAHYLRNVSKDFDLYKQYFIWKKEKSIKLCISKTWFCELCTYLHINDKKPLEKENRKDLVTWWFDESKCWSWSLPKTSLKK